jgi:hypothetical protein
MYHTQPMVSEYPRNMCLLVKNRKLIIVMNQQYGVTVPRHAIAISSSTLQVASRENAFGQPVPYNPSPSTTHARAYSRREAA